MKHAQLFADVLAMRDKVHSPRDKSVSLALGLCGAIGLLLAFAGGSPGAGWLALLVATTMTIGVAAVGVVFAAIFHITAARWGRPFQRFAEAGVALMPLGLLCLLALVLGGHAWLPWLQVDHLTGGKHAWLVRGFWDVRVLLTLVCTYALSLTFVYYAWRRDFCLGEVRAAFTGRLGAWLGRGITDAEREMARCTRRLDVLAPAVIIVYALAFSFLAFDLIMALEPDWYSTLFGAWYFISHLFVGLAAIVLITTVLWRRLSLERFVSMPRQRDLATLLFAFCLVHMDFFWSQFLTIWYAHLPEFTFYLIDRTLDPALPYHHLTWPALAAFFFIPFGTLLFRRVKSSRLLLSAVAIIAISGVLLARFIEAAPALLTLDSPSVTGLFLPLAATALVALGVIGVAIPLYQRLLTSIPLMPLSDEVFLATQTHEEHP